MSFRKALYRLCRITFLRVQHLFRGANSQPRPNGVAGLGWGRLVHLPREEAWQWCEPQEWCEVKSQKCPEYDLVSHTPASSEA